MIVNLSRTRLSLSSCLEDLAAYSFFPKKQMIAVERIEPEEKGLIHLSLFQ